MTEPGVTPAPLPSGLTLDQWIADGRAILGMVDQYLPLDLAALANIAGALVSALAKAIENPSPSAELTAIVDTEQAALAAAAAAKFGGK